MAETDTHRDLMYALIETLRGRFAVQEDVYVSGNLLIFYEEGNKRRHVSPDVFVVKGVHKHSRPNYLLWEEGRGPNVAIELTSSSTRKEDTQKKFDLYRDVLKIPEYFLFDPFGDYLKPRFQAYRLLAGQYRPIRITHGQATSRELGLILHAAGDTLRLIDPQTGLHIPSPSESQLADAAARRSAEESQRSEAVARRAAEELANRETEARRKTEAENERLRAELAEIRSHSKSANGTSHK